MSEKPTMTTELVESMNERLALVIRAVLQERLEGMTRAEQVTLLEDMGCRDEDITAILGISQANLRAIRSDMGDN